MITPLQGAQAVTAATGAATAASAGLGGLGKDAFLQLLVAQLRYQNPLSPTDGQEYLAQSAQFATVERLENLAKAQAELVGYQQITLATSLVGKSVTGTPPGSPEPVTGTVTGVRFAAGTAVLRIGDQELPVGSVEEVTPNS